MPFRSHAVLLLQRGVDKRKAEELRAAFYDADTNGDGFLTTDEYARVFQEQGVDISHEEVVLYFSNKDKDQDGRISYKEFCGKKTINEIAFQALDINSDGFISQGEMLAACSRVGRRLSAKDIDSAFEVYDQDKDKKLSYEEFCVMMNRRRSSIQIDPEDPKTKELFEAQYGSSGDKYRLLEEDDGGAEPPLED